jgi:UTP--glucose-1-phosphate uridylyltransferase
MLPVIDKPVLQYIVEEAAASGIEEVIVITSRGQQAIEDHFDRYFELESRLQQTGKVGLLEEVVRPATLARMVFVRQAEPLGNGHAVLCARQIVGDEPFAMLWGDDLVMPGPGEQPCLTQLLRTFEHYDSSILAAMRVPREEWNKYGMIGAEPIDGRTLRVRSIVEKPPIDESPSDLAQVKGCILTPEIFEILARTPAKKGNEIWLMDAIQQLIAAQPVYAYIFEGKRFDTGNALDYLKTNIEYGLARPDLAEAFKAYLCDLVRGLSGDPG